MKTVSTPLIVVVVRYSLTGNDDSVHLWSEHTVVVKCNVLRLVAVTVLVVPVVAETDPETETDPVTGADAELEATESTTEILNSPAGPSTGVPVKASNLVINSWGMVALVSKWNLLWMAADEFEGGVTIA